MLRLVLLKFLPILNWFEHLATSTKLCNGTFAVTCSSIMINIVFSLVYVYCRLKNRLREDKLIKNNSNQDEAVYKPGTKKEVNSKTVEEEINNAKALAKKTADLTGL